MRARKKLYSRPWLESRGVKPRPLSLGDRGDTTLGWLSTQQHDNYPSWIRFRESEREIEDDARETERERERRRGEGGRK